MLVGIVGMYAIGFRASWMAKRALFRWPYGGFFRWLGGVPVDRRAKQGLVDQMIAAYTGRSSLILAILPEGTRSRTRRWKSGFYHIAVGATVPLVMMKFDYGHKQLAFGPVFHPTGDIDSELPQIKSFFQGVKGKLPQNTE